MRTSHHAGILPHGGVAHPWARPGKPKSRSNVKRIAAGTLAEMVRPFRSLKPLEWLVSRAFQVWYEMPVTPTHFYSPLPDVAFLKGNLDRWYREKNLTGIRMNFGRQTELLKSLVPFAAECERLPKIEAVNAEGFGLGYGEIEAHLLHSVIRYLKPRNFIEVGSGVSTFFALNALEINRQTDGIDFSMQCVDPYPSAQLCSLTAHNQVRIFRKPVQDIEPWIFDQLGDRDILFIDSSHVSKLDSDVNFLVLDILPRLRKGVVIHVHDIPFPYMTCPPGHPMFEKSLLWNEAPLMRAFLMWNEVFEILMCQSYLHLTYPDSIKMVTNAYDPQRHFPSSLWIQKVA